MVGLELKEKLGKAVRDRRRIRRIGERGRGRAGKSLRDGNVIASAVVVWRHRPGSTVIGYALHGAYWHERAV